MKILCPHCHQQGVKRLMTPIEGRQNLTDTDGDLAYECICPAGHRQAFKRVIHRGPCPNCNHRWVEKIKGQGDKPKAAPTSVRVHEDGSTNFGLSGFKY